MNNIDAEFMGGDTANMMFDSGMNGGAAPDMVNFISSGPFVAILLITSLISLFIGSITIVSLWKIFTKAGKPGWASIIPIYNIIVILEIVKRPIWWLVLFFIPFVHIVIMFMVFNDLSKSFGKDIGYTIGLIFLPIIFLPMLGFGNSTYTPPVANQ